MANKNSQQKCQTKLLSNNMVMQLKLNPRQKCYTKLLSNIVSTGVAQTTTMTKLLQKILLEQLSAGVAQTTSTAEMVNKISQLQLQRTCKTYTKQLSNNISTGTVPATCMTELLHKIAQKKQVFMQLKLHTWRKCYIKMVNNILVQTTNTAEMLQRISQQ